MAHATLRGIEKPAGYEAQVFTAADLGPIHPLTAGPDMPAFRNTVYPPLAEGRVRFAGQPVALCLAPTRAEAEDIADLVMLDLDPLPPVVDAVAAMRPGSPQVYEQWPDGAFIANTVAAGDLAAVAARAPVRVHRQFKMNRQACASLEGRAVMAYRDRRVDELVVYMSTQGPHVMRMALAQTLGIPEHRLRVIAPDVGGGFGGKNRLTPEEIAVVALAMQVDHPVRWIEDRREHLLASAHAREHFYDMTLYAEADGTFLGLDADIYIDAGAYSLWPTGAFAEAAMAARNIPGPYRIQNLRARNWTVATNKAPMGPYRGVARPGACFAIERMVDEVARELGMDPLELRRRNIVTSAELPYQTAGGMTLDTGDYVACLDAAEVLIDRDAVRARQARGEPDGRRIGLGFAFYTEQSGHGTAEWTRRKSRVVPGYETSTVRMMPDGTAQLLVGIQSHGQGMETTLAQIAAHELGMTPDQISVRHGDTGISPFGFGTFASRSIVMAGGAVAKSSRMMGDVLRRIGAHLLQTDIEQTTLEGGQVRAGVAAVSFAEIGRAAHVRSDLLPEGTGPVLEVTATYEPRESGGAFSYATHAVVVAVDPGHWRGGAAGLRRVRGLRHHDQSDDRGRPGDGRRGAGHRHGAVRGNPVRRGRPAAGHHLRRIPDALRQRATDDPREAYGHAVDLHGIWREGCRRRRGHRAAGRDHQRGGRCVPRQRRGVQHNALHAPPNHRGARRGSIVKPSVFDFARPATLPDALAMLDDTAVPLSGGQSLLVLLRLRLTTPEMLVEVARLPELTATGQAEGRVRYGAATTHAAIEDGVVPDASCGLMQRAASGIAYRAVRNLGTIGGSLALADPAADWPLCLLALDAAVVLQGPDGARLVGMDAFLISAYTTALQPGEIITAIEVPVLPPGSRWGYCKLARKHGAFADSLVAAVWPAGGAPRIALGATMRRAVLLPRTMAALAAGDGLDAVMAAEIAEADPDADFLSPAVPSFHAAQGIARNGATLMRVEFTLNGRPHRHDGEPRETLADTLRDRAGLTGLHLGCEQGACGACTVLMDGVIVRSCLVLTAMCSDPRRAHARRPARRPGDEGAEASVPHLPCPAMRLLHAGDAGDRIRHHPPSSGARRRDRAPRAGRPDLPLHRLCRHRECHPASPCRAGGRFHGDASMIRLDAYTHFFPMRYFERMQELVTDKGSIKRWVNLPMLWDLEKRLRLVDSFGDYQQILSNSQPPIEVVTTPDLAPDLARPGQ